MVLHMMAVVQLRNPTEGRAYYDRKMAAGKSPNEAMRCLKRRLSDIVYRAMLDDYVATKRQAREDTGERHFNPARPAHIPTPALRISHFPDPSPESLRPPCPRRLDTEGSQIRTLAGLSLLTAAIKSDNERLQSHIGSYLEHDDAVADAVRHAEGRLQVRRSSQPL